MIRDLNELKNRGGRWYVADFRFDEGIRIREDPICATLARNQDGRSISNSLFLIEVIGEEGETMTNAINGMRIRRLTPRECFRLQGFPDEYFDRAAAVCPDAQLYKQAGNSVTVNVIYEIAKRLELDE